MRPKVSVLMPMYNAAATVRRALQAITLQTFEDWEVIVVDDGSDDGSLEVARRFDDARVRVLSYQPNRGRGYARAVALEAARGDFIAFCDADDLWMRHKLARQVALLEQQTEPIAVSCEAMIADAQSAIVGVTQTRPSGGVLRLQVPGRMPWVFAASCWRAPALRQVGFDTTMRSSEDLHCVLRALMGRTAVILPAGDYVWRRAERFAYSTHADSYAALRKILRPYALRYPVTVAREQLFLELRRVLTRAAFQAGSTSWLLKRGTRPATVAEAEAWRVLLSELEAKCEAEA